MYNEKLGLYIGLCSYKRPHTVAPMVKMLGTEDFTWYLRNEEEAESYRRAGAVNRKVSVGYPDGRPGDLVRKRNEIMDDGFSLGHTVLLLSDDMYDVKKINENPHATGGKGGGLEWLDSNFEESVRSLLWAMDLFPNYMMGGIPPVANLFYIHHHISTNLFCIGDYMIIKPNPLRMDERIKLKHDYDLTAKHIKTYGGIVRNDFSVPFFEHYKPGVTGGCGTVRNTDLEDQDIRYLMENHPGMFMPHFTRDHEVRTKFISSLPSIVTFKNKPHYIARQEIYGTDKLNAKGRNILEDLEIARKRVEYYKDKDEVLLTRLNNNRALLEKEKRNYATLLERATKMGLNTGVRLAPEQRRPELWDPEDPYDLKNPNRDIDYDTTEYREQ